MCVCVRARACTGAHVLLYMQWSGILYKPKSQIKVSTNSLIQFAFNIRTNHFLSSVQSFLVVAFNIRNYEQAQACFSINIQSYSHWVMTRQQIRFAQASTLFSSFFKTFLSRSEKNLQDYTEGSSNWILMSCQPHRVTSGQSNSGHKQIHCQISRQNQSLHKHKTNSVISSGSV